MYVTSRVGHVNNRFLKFEYVKEIILIAHFLVIVSHVDVNILY